jgi:hypothetical protein
MRLDNSLERLANRGTHRDPLAVITQARDGSSVLDDTDTLAEIIDLERVDGGGRQRRALALTVAAAVVITIGAAGVMIRNRSSEPIVFSESAGEPSLPSPLTEVERAAALTRCISESNATSEAAGVVDARPEGLLVGLSTSGVWSTCFFPSVVSTQSSLVPIAPTARVTPNALSPEVSASRPIVVVDASGQKGIDGPQGSKVVNGSEVTWVWGRIDRSIASVIVTTHTAQYVPTIVDGLFAVWWRGNNSDETIVRGFDSAGNEVAFVDQVNCYTATPVNADGGTYTPPTRRLVVNGIYIEGGCIGGEHAKPGATADQIGDGK